MTALVTAIKNHVTDRDTLAAIANEFQRLVAMYVGKAPTAMSG